MTTIGIAVVVAALVLLLVGGRRTFAKFLGAGRAQVGKLGRAVEEADPMALYQQIVDDGVNDIQNAKSGLENARTLVKSVERQVASGEAEVKRLTNRIQVAVDAGDPNNTASENALTLAEVEKQLGLNKEQLQKHQETYKSFAKRVEQAQKKVVEARDKARTLGVQLQMSEREKELSKFAESFTFDPNKLNDGLARAEELIQQKIDKNKAAGEVAAEMNKQAAADAADDELERQAAAAEILKRFKKPEVTNA